MTPPAHAGSPRRRSLVLVAGSGRSGTSLFSGILQRLGFRVPPPEVPADDTNPRGFAESQWVVDFHTDLLRSARVQVADARPAAWAHTAQACLDEDVQRRLRAWLEQQFRAADDLVIKDPRLSWFLPLWRQCAEQVDARPAFVTMLRHPAAVIDSKQRWYGGDQGETGRAAGWINQTLFTERATRESPRVFVPYDDLLEDWTRAVGRVGVVLDLAVVRDAPAPAIREVHGFVDQRLSRSRPDWGDSALPPALRARADEVWTLVCALADDATADADAIGERLDAVRVEYLELYAEAEAIAQSSIVAAGRGPRPSATGGARIPAPALWLIRSVPERHRRRVPARWRSSIARVLRRGWRPRPVAP
jgi:hypothetical protein